MMDNLQKLRKANPHIQIYSIHHPAFRHYGAVIEADTGSFCSAAETISMPETGSRYSASIPELETLAEANWLREVNCGGLDQQIGLCWGHSHQLNALEWHTCNEFNIAVRDLVLLLAKREDLDDDGRLNADRVRAFYLARGEMIEVYSDTLHFCPCEVTREGFSCIVGLQRGTNLPLAPEQKTGRLWAANKWLLAHEANTELVRRDAFPGIYGENWEINPVN